MNLSQSQAQSKRKAETPFKSPSKAMNFGQKTPQSQKYFIGKGYESRCKNNSFTTCTNLQTDARSCSSSIKLQVKSPTHIQQFSYSKSINYMNDQSDSQINLKLDKGMAKSTNKQKQILSKPGKYLPNQSNQCKQTCSQMTKLQEMKSIIQQIENYQKGNTQSFGKLPQSKYDKQQLYMRNIQRHNSIENLYNRLEKLEKGQNNNLNTRVSQNKKYQFQSSFKKPQISRFQLSSLRTQQKEDKIKELQNYYKKQLNKKNRQLETYKNINQRLQAELFTLQRSKIDLIKHNELLSQCLKQSKQSDQCRSTTIRASGRSIQYLQILQLSSPKNQKPLYSKIFQKEQKQKNYVNLLKEQLEQKQSQVTKLNIDIQKLHLQLNTYNERQNKIKEELLNKTQLEVNQIINSYGRSFQILDVEINHLNHKNNYNQVTIQNMKVLIAQKDKIIKQIFELKASIEQFKYQIIKKLKSQTDTNNLIDIQIQGSQIIQIIKKENIELKDRLFQMKKSQLIYLQKIKHLDNDIKNSRIVFLKDELSSYEKQTKNNQEGLHKLANLQAKKLQLFKAKQRKIEQVNRFFQKANRNIEFIIQKQQIETQKQQIPVYKCKFSLVSSQRSLNSDKNV